MSYVFVEEIGGLEEINNGILNAAFGPLVLSRLHEGALGIEDVNGYRSRNPGQVKQRGLELSLTDGLGRSRIIA